MRRRYDPIIHPGWPLAAGAATCLAGLASRGTDWLPPLGWAAAASLLLASTLALARLRRDRDLRERSARATGRARALEILLHLLNDQRDRAQSAVDAGAAETQYLRQDLRELCSREMLSLKSQFVSGVGHELRTPLASIKAYAEMLIDGEARDEATRQQFYEIIQSEANRLSSLIENILNLSRIEAGVASADLQVHDLTDIVTEAAHAVALPARLKQIAVDVPTTPPTHRTPRVGVRCDRELLLQVVVNLLTNAIRHTPERASVAVDLQADPVRRTVTLRVTDHGPALDPRTLPFVFDKFYLGTATDGRAVHGTGLGLSMVRHVIETLHGGRAFAQPLPDQTGNTFGFHLETTEFPPAAAPPPPTARAERDADRRSAAPRAPIENPTDPQTQHPGPNHAHD